MRLMLAGIRHRDQTASRRNMTSNSLLSISHDPGGSECHQMAERRQAMLSVSYYQRCHSRCYEAFPRLIQGVRPIVSGVSARA